MRIAYLAIWDVCTHSGVTQKISHQMRAWKELGHEVHGFFLCPSSAVGKPPLINDSLVWFTRSKGNIALFFNRPQSLKKMEIAIRKFRPDIVYFRQAIYFPMLAGLLNRTAPYLVEINTDDLAEFDAIKSGLFALYNRITRYWITRKAGALVCISEEIRKREKQRQNVPCFTMSNGIITQDIPFYRSSTSSGLTIGLMGSPGYPWHGIDEICRLAVLPAFQNVNFRIVGIRPEELGWNKIPKNVSFLGYLVGEELEKAFRSFDISFGTVSLHRKNMCEASPLKVRDYLARGIPVILPYKDTDLEGKNFEFCLKLPNCQNNLVENKTIIFDFALRCFHSKSLRLQARDFAVNQLSYVSKFKQLFKELSQIGINVQ